MHYYEICTTLNVLLELWKSWGDDLDAKPFPKCIIMKFAQRSTFYYNSGSLGVTVWMPNRFPNALL
jgi:hypothetical protein